MKFYVRVVVIVLFCLALLIVSGLGFKSLANKGIENRYYNEYQNSVDNIQASVRNQSLLVEPNYQKAVASSNTFLFSDVFVLSQDGVVLYSTDDSVAIAFVHTIPESAQAVFLSGIGGHFEYTYNDEEMLLLLSKTKDSDVAKVAAILPMSDHAANVDGSNMYLVLQIIAMVAISAATVLLLALVVKHRDDDLYHVKPVKNYLITVKESGRIISANELFARQFKRHSLTDALVDKSLFFPTLVKSGDVIIVELPEKESKASILKSLQKNKKKSNNVPTDAEDDVVDTEVQEEVNENVNDTTQQVVAESRKVAFVASSTTAGYKLLGADVTELVDDYHSLKHRLSVDPYSKLWNHTRLQKDWDKLVQTVDMKNCLIANIRAHNRNFFATLFGETNMRTSQEAYARSLISKLGEFGTLYSPDTEEELLLVTDLNKKEEFLRRLNELTEKLNQPFRTQYQMMLLDMRVGVVLLDAATKETTLEEVIAAGQKSIKQTILNDHTPFYVLRPATFVNSRRALTSREGVMQLMQAGNIDVWFQPQYDVVSQRIVGFEALTRIVGDRAKEITIFDFINVAEQTGMIIELGEFIYKRAMDFAKIIQDKDVTVSINVSPIQLMHMGFVDSFLKAHKERGIRANMVDVEIVESTVIYSMKDVIRKLKALASEGVNAHIDDFGVAYSSMYYLKQLPVTTLKIDKCFVDDLGLDKADTSIVANIINLVKDLGMKCIAEGVETDKQVETLKRLGCSIIQGYWIGAALPREKAYELVVDINEKRNVK